MSTSIEKLPGEWTETVWLSLTELATEVAGFIPNLIGMIVIIIVGYVVARILKKVVSTILKKVGFDKASDKIGLRSTLEKSGVATSASTVMGTLIFWLIMLTFLISAAETLGLENVSRTIDSFVSYLPNVIAAALIAVIGLMLAHFVRTMVVAAAEGAGIEYAKPISALVYGVLLIVVGTLAISQLGINTILINEIIGIVLLAAGAALALSLGLGTRNISKDIIAGVYARDVFAIGTTVSFGSVNGTIEAVQTISTAIKTVDGSTIHVPNSRLVSSVVEAKS